jgi:hypothetical protein
VATQASGSTGTNVQAWVTLKLAAQLREQAVSERRSVSGVVRHALEDALEGKERRRKVAPA